VSSFDQISAPSSGRGLQISLVPKRNGTRVFMAKIGLITALAARVSNEPLEAISWESESAVIKT
jgi:hypothetical protein